MAVLLGMGTLGSAAVVMWCEASEGPSPAGETEWERAEAQPRPLPREAFEAEVWEEVGPLGGGEPPDDGVFVDARSDARLSQVRRASLEWETSGAVLAMSTSTSTAPRARPAFRRLPLVHLERAADGLPVNALRCSKDGRCGDCQTDSECSAGRACVVNQDTRRFECMESECEQDTDCGRDAVCRAASPGISGPVIQRCMPAGLRGQGESCDLLFVSREGACQRGLVCHRSVCSTPCSSEGRSRCPEGFACEEGLDGSACFPDCRARGCAADEVCKQLDDTDYQCLERVEGQCPEQACAEGERCNMRMSRGRAVFWCAPRCDALREDSCPVGDVCGVGGPTESTCYRGCDPRQPEGCGVGFQCASVTEDMSRFGCTPEVRSGSASLPL